eukprot:1158746-Pelagomonas_calceolata.AAC.1
MSWPDAPSLPSVLKPGMQAKQKVSLGHPEFGALEGRWMSVPLLLLLRSLPTARTCAQEPDELHVPPGMFAVYSCGATSAEQPVQPGVVG